MKFGPLMRAEPENQRRKRGIRRISEWSWRSKRDAVHHAAVHERNRVFPWRTKIGQRPTLPSTSPAEPAEAEHAGERTDCSAWDVGQPLGLGGGAFHWCGWGGFNGSWMKWMGRIERIDRPPRPPNARYGQGHLSSNGAIGRGTPGHSWAVLLGTRSY